VGLVGDGGEEVAEAVDGFGYYVDGVVDFVVGVVAREAAVQPVKAGKDLLFFGYMEQHHCIPSIL